MTIRLTPHADGTIVELFITGSSTRAKLQAKCSTALKAAGPEFSSRRCVAALKANDPFAALAHPIRREILLILRDQPDSSAGAIALKFPRVTRAAVSRHLGILRRARMVRTHRRRRESHYFLRTDSLAALHQEWCERFDPMLEGSLERLKAAAGRDDGEATR